MEFKDYYKILGVNESAGQDEIKRAYRKLARRYHPDVSKEPDAEQRFKEVGEAYEALKDPEKRAAYDRLKQGGYRGGEPFTAPPDWDEAGFSFHGGGFTDAGEFSDFFESLFGRSGPERGFRGYRFQEPAYDQRARVSIDLEDAFHGTTRTFQLPDSTGSAVRTVKVNIPKGITAGQQIRLAGQGGGSGKNRGDLYLEVEFRPHRLYHPEGRDIFLDLPITPWEAALGETVKVPTLGGHVELRIPPGSQSGRKLRLKGRGLPGSPPGDQYVVLKIVTPRAETPEAEEIYRRMAETMAWNPRHEMEA